MTVHLFNHPRALPNRPTLRVIFLHALLVRAKALLKLDVDLEETDK